MTTFDTARQACWMSRNMEKRDALRRRERQRRPLHGHATGDDDAARNNAEIGCVPTRLFGL